jgi:hypothetical protein
LRRALRLAGPTLDVPHPREALDAAGERPVLDDGRELLPAGFERLGATSGLFLPFPFARLGLPAFQVRVVRL